MPKITETFFARNRRTWRIWFSRHHATKKEIWLVLLKKHVVRASVSYEEAVEEALCFGWIDGILKRIDGEKHAIRFSPRKKNSIWSEQNKRRVRKLIREGRMTEAGMALVRAAKKSGQWHKAIDPKKAQSLPADLKKALARNQKARENFKKLAPSYRRMYIGWILHAKRDETRQRRIREVVRRAEAKQKPGIDM